MGKGRLTQSLALPCLDFPDKPVALNRTLLPRAKRKGRQKSGSLLCCPLPIPPSFPLRSAEIESLRLGDFSGPRREEEGRRGLRPRSRTRSRLRRSGVSYVRPRPRRQRQAATHSVTISVKSAANWPLKRLPSPLRHAARIIAVPKLGRKETGQQAGNGQQARWIEPRSCHYNKGEGRKRRLLKVLLEQSHLGGGGGDELIARRTDHQGRLLLCSKIAVPICVTDS